ncbi:MAG TPA: TonB C-terminal domain-containing protein [Bryobacteraceae bacterium]|nr:TonB C-terminal domain-containing protein [Bryobacteraceae bacterium]
MTQHADILDSHERIGAAFAGAIALHVSLVAAILISGWIAAHTQTFGAKDAGGAAVGIEAVNSIPIPHHGMQNPLANDTQSETPQTPVKQPERQKAEKPPKDAVALKMKNIKKPAKAASERQRYRPYEELEQSQLTSSQAPQVSSPVFSAQPGSGRVGTGANTTLGTRCAGYAAQIQQLVAQHWRTGDVDARVQTAPVVIATYTLMGDGSIRDVRLLQTSGIGTLDFSVQRAILDAAPFPPIPSICGKDSAKVEFTFELKR